MSRSSKSGSPENTKAISRTPKDHTSTIAEGRRFNGLLGEALEAIEAKVLNSKPDSQPQALHYG